MAHVLYEVAYMAVVSNTWDGALSAGALAPASGPDISAAEVAAVERQVASGDRWFKAGKYDRALRAYRKARAMIYRLQKPDFDVNGFVLADAVALPVSKALEAKLLDVSGRMAELVRPVIREPSTRFVTDGPAPDEIAPFLRSGYREKTSADSVAEEAAVQAIMLLQENKADVAAVVLESAPKDIGRRGIDPTISGALKLDLAAAHLQAGGTEQSLKAGEQAQRDFARGKDLVGQAQAAHVRAMAFEQAGETDKAAKFFAQAANLLQKAGGRDASRGAAPGEPRIEDRRIENRNLPIRPSVSGGLGAITPLGEAAAPLFATRLAAVEEFSSRDVADLPQISEKRGGAISYRIPGRGEGWGSLALPDTALKRQQDKPWSLGIMANGGLAQFSSGTGNENQGAMIAAQIYEPRIQAASATELGFVLAGATNTMFFLTHLYAYVLPLKVGDCHHELGQFRRAEQHYLQAAGYSYLNTSIEAVALWIRLARNCVEWGDALYKQEDLPGAAAQYSRLVNEDGTVPVGSNLYAQAKLKAATDQAKTLIQNIQARPLPQTDWEIAIAIMTALARLQQIAENLDFYGLALSPIHTFEYLQSVARGFTQEAIQAEREFLNFKVRQEGEEATRRDLEAAVAMARAEADAKKELWRAAEQDVTASERAVELAQQRHVHAVQQRNDYAASSNAQIWAQAAATALGMGEDALYGEISELADKLARGERLKGAAGLLAAAVTLYAGRKTRQYELDKMDDNIADLADAIVVAQAQLQSARNRATAAEILWQAAEQKAAMAGASLDAFDDEFFTPEAWEKMANVMRNIAREYLYRAIRIAKLMERAYNFDNDTDYSIIKNQYGYALGNAAGEAAKLLGGDSLLVDIESFTYIAITSKTRKNSRIKDKLSVAAKFPAHFEEFKRTGLLSIETDLYEFDRLHPGYFAQRIEAVEVEIVGLLPSEGLNGTLTAGGVTRFRKKDGSGGQRVHQVDTQALSGFFVRTDAFLYSTETGVRGLFQGMGLGSTWQLHLPKRSNDFDFNRVFDVNLVFYYTATFDKALRAQVLAAPARPGETSLLRMVQLRYDFPDSWYGLYKDGAVTFDFDRMRLPANQTDFEIEAAHFRVITRPGISPENIELRLTAPNGTVATLTTDADGVVTSTGSALSGIHGTNPIGEWTIEPLSGASITEADELRLERVYNIQMGLEYGFELPVEVL